MGSPDGCQAASSDGAAVSQFGGADLAVVGEVSNRLLPVVVWAGS